MGFIICCGIIVIIAYIIAGLGMLALYKLCKDMSEGMDDYYTSGSDEGSAETTFLIYAKIIFIFAFL